MYYYSNNIFKDNNESIKVMTIRKFFKNFVPIQIRQFIKNFTYLLLSKGRRFMNSHDVAYLDSSVHVLGWKNIKFGKNSVISEGCWLNINNRESTKVQIEIGNNTFIGRRNFFSSGNLIRIGDYCLTGIDCKFMGSNHIYSDPMKPYITTGTTDEWTINVGANCWLGAGVSIIGNVKIGHGSIIGADALINKDIPPFSLVVGNPGKIIKRYDIDTSRWVSAFEFTEEQESRLPSELNYLQILQFSYPTVHMPVRAASKALGDLP